MKTLVTALCFAVSLQCTAKTNCDGVVEACQALAKEQSTEITLLKNRVRELNYEVIASRNRESSLPSWAWVLIGAAAAVSIRGITK